MCLISALQQLLGDTSCKAAKAEHKQVSQDLHKQMTQDSAEDAYRQGVFFVVERNKANYQGADC